jgi:hypothetical protein
MIAIAVIWLAAIIWLVRAGMVLERRYHSFGGNPNND